MMTSAILVRIASFYCAQFNLLVSLPSSTKSLLILSPTSPSGILTSSLVVPSSDMRERKPSSVTSSCRK